MKTVGIVEAQTHLSALLDRVAKGEKITITRHGVPTAMLIPFAEAERKLSHQEILEGLRALRKCVKPGKMSVKQMIEERRRI